jgi:uncharacterized membrane protein
MMNSEERIWLKIKNMIRVNVLTELKVAMLHTKQQVKRSDLNDSSLIDGDSMPNENFFNMQLVFYRQVPEYRHSTISLASM